MQCVSPSGVWDLTRPTEEMWAANSFRLLCLLSGSMAGLMEKSQSIVHVQERGVGARYFF